MPKSDADLELCYLSATEALAKFQSRELSPVELTRALIARSEALNPRLNVLPELKRDSALAAARAAEAKYAKPRAARLRPLEGVPVAIKDFHPVKGEITTFGSHAFRDFRPAHSALAVGDQRQQLRFGAHPPGRPKLGECLRPVPAVVGGDADGFPDRGDTARAGPGGLGVRQRGLGVGLHQLTSSHQMPCHGVGGGFVQGEKFGPDLRGELLGLDGGRDRRPAG